MKSTYLSLRHGLVGLTLLAGTLALACAPTAAPQAPAPAKPSEPQVSRADFARPELLWETETLAQRLNDPKLRIIDLRAAAKYSEGHITGAVNLNSNDLDRRVSEQVQDVAGPEKVSEVLGNLGIAKDTQVVLYDDQKTLIAGRVFWVLDYYGHEKVAILNGGFPKWAAENRPVTRAVPKVEKAQFAAVPHPERVADKQYVLANLGTKSVVLFDVRTPGEYEGSDVRAARGGRIPGAVNVNWEENLTAGNTPIMKEAAKLKELYASAGLTPDKEIITYCQSGVRAGQSYFTLKLLGYEKVRNYDGSWQDWGNDPNTPIEQGKKG